MRKGGSKGKGSSFEREVCVALSKWLTNGKSIDVFWRSAMSGGRATVAKGKVRQSGDITAVAPEGHILTDHLYIECKHLKDISLDALIKSKGTFINIWQKTIEEAEKYNKHPVLIFRQNHWPTMLCTSLGGYDYLVLQPEHILIKSGGLHMLRFDSFLKIPCPF